MAITLDAYTGAAAINTTSITFAHTVSGSDRYLLVSVVKDGIGSSVSVTYNGVSMTLLGQAIATPWGFGACHLFGLIAPATGTNNVVVSISPTDWIVTCAARSFNGVHQTIPVGTYVGGFDGNGDSSPITITVSSAIGELVVDGGGQVGNGTLTAGVGQTSHYNNNINISSHTFQDAGSIKAGSTSVGISWQSNRNAVWVWSGISLKPVGASIATDFFRRRV